MGFFYQPTLLSFDEYQKLDRGNRLAVVLDNLDAEVADLNCRGRVWQEDRDIIDRGARDKPGVEAPVRDPQC